MDTHIMLLVAAMVGLILLLMLVVGLVTSRRRRARRRLIRSVNATITDIGVEASSLSSWWTITAEWTDPQTGYHYHFRSPPIRARPQQRVGEQIAVDFDATRPKDYFMAL